MCVDSSLSSEIWKPDLSFTDAKEAKKHYVVRDNIFLEISHDGTIFLSEDCTLSL